MNVCNKTTWIFCQINDLTEDFFKNFFFATDTCSVKRSIWKYFQNDFCMKHCFMILCDFYDFQLLIKNLLHIENLKCLFISAIKIVNFLKHAKHQLNILRQHQKEIYEKTYLLIAFIILRWSTQVSLLKLLLCSKVALKIYVKNSKTKFATNENFQNIQQNFMLENLFDFNFWNEMGDFLIIWKSIHDQQKLSEKNEITIDQINYKWIEIRHYLIQCIVWNRFENAIQKFLINLFDVKFNKQIITIHCVAFYLYFLQIKTFMS